MKKVYEKPRVTQVELLSGEAVMDPGCKNSWYEGPLFHEGGQVCGHGVGQPCYNFSAGS